MTASVRNWAAEEDGRIARSLGQALQLLNDLRYFSSGSDEAKRVHILAEQRAIDLETKLGEMEVVFALSVLEESPFRNPDQIPYLEPPPSSIHNLTRAEEEDTQSMRALVEEIDSHTELNPVQGQT